MVITWTNARGERQSFRSILLAVSFSRPGSAPGAVLSISCRSLGQDRSALHPSHATSKPTRRKSSLATAVMFIAGHELAHVSKGHVGRVRRVRRHLIGKDLKLSNHDQRMEPKADERSLRWLLDAAQPRKARCSQRLFSYAPCSEHTTTSDSAAPATLATHST